MVRDWLRSGEDGHVIDLEALFAAVLHPEEFAFGGVKVGALDLARPECIHRHVHGVALETEFYRVPFVARKVHRFRRKKLVGAIDVADRIGFPVVLTEQMSGVWGMVSTGRRRGR